jgi:TfoX/Sxy family transcriptional regulator of competence genes
MSYDEKLADRIRRALGPRDDIEERKMFGGLAFLRDGRMFCGIAKDDLMVRVGPEGYEAALGRPHVRPMDFTGRPMKGYVFVAPQGRRTDAALRAWVELSASFVATLPARAPKRRGPSPKRRRQ